MTTTQRSGSSTGETRAREKAQNVAETAADEGRHVVGTAREEVGQVAGEARDQARELFSQLGTQVEEQSRDQQQRLAGTVRTFSDDLSDMTTDRSGLASDLTREAADRARSLANQLENREPRDLLEDVRGFARRRPGTFLLGAMAAGLVAGRFTRAAQAAKQEDDQTGSAGGTLPVAVEDTATITGGPVVAVPPSGSFTTSGTPGASTAEPHSGAMGDEAGVTPSVVSPASTARPQPGSEL